MIDLQQLARLLSKAQVKELLTHFYMKEAIETLCEPGKKRKKLNIDDIADVAQQLGIDDQRWMLDDLSAYNAKQMLQTYDNVPNVEDVEAVVILNKQEVAFVQESLTSMQDKLSRLRKSRIGAGLGKVALSNLKQAEERAEAVSLLIDNSSVR